MTENGIGKIIVGGALSVHKALGPGLLESAYAVCLFHELVKAGLGVRSEVPVPIVYDGVKLECGYRIDLLAEEKVIVEIKSVESLNDVHLAQLITYLKLSNLRLGFLINFNVKLKKYGIRRVVNNL